MRKTLTYPLLPDDEHRFRQRQLYNNMQEEDLDIITAFYRLTAAIVQLFIHTYLSWAMNHFDNAIYRYLVAYNL